MPGMQVQAKGDTLIFSRVAGLLAQASCWPYTAPCPPVSAPARASLSQGSPREQPVKPHSLAFAFGQCTAAVALPGPLLPMLCRLMSVSHSQVPQGFLLQVWSLWAQQAGVPLQRCSMPQVPGHRGPQPHQLPKVPDRLA